MQVALLLTIAVLVSFSVSANAADKLPYEYTFVEEVGSLFNGIAPIKQMEITFDENIQSLNLTTIDKSNGVITPNGTGNDDILKSINLQGNKITVQFQNLESIDYSKTNQFGYELVINGLVIESGGTPGSYTFPFNIYDLLPGFQSTFTLNDASILNNNIFKNNSPRDVFIYLPAQYMTKIETIHKYDGVVNKPDVAQGPALTNIDVLADDAAKRLKVEFKNEEQYSRDLAPHPDLKGNGFTMGQAGIEDITDGNLESNDEFNLRAYSEYGRLLEKRSFKLRVLDPEKNYKVGDYLPKANKKFGTTVTLYDLMNDAKLLEAVVTSITDLDTIGVTYALGNTGGSTNPGTPPGTPTTGEVASESANQGNWDSGKQIILTTMEDKDPGNTNTYVISHITNWAVIASNNIYEFKDSAGNPIQVKAEWSNTAPTTLKIEVLTQNATNHPIEGSVVLEGEDSTGQKYRVEIPITITN